MKKKAKNILGFTLTELLVAIVILGIITALAIPLISAIQANNKDRKYDTYLDNLEYSAKLYVDAYAEDIFKHEESGCAYIKYSDLKDKMLLKDIEIDNLSCATEDTYVKVVKVGDIIYYTPTIGCGVKNDSGVVENITVHYPAAYSSDPTCGVDTDNIMGFKFTPESSDDDSKKKVNISVTITSNTGFNPQSIISYGFYHTTNPNDNDYNKVVQWHTMSMDIPDVETQKQMIQNDGKVTLVAKNITTPQGETGTYKLVLRIEYLTDIVGVKWKDIDGFDYIYSPGTYKIDNQPPSVSGFTITTDKVADNNQYRSTTPYINFTATDNNKYTMNKEQLLYCYSLDSDTCSTVVADLKAGESKNYFNYIQGTNSSSPPYGTFVYLDGSHRNQPKVSPIKGHPETVSDYDSSYHTLYITVTDRAGNYTKVNGQYRLAQRYHLIYNMNPRKYTASYYTNICYNKDVIYNYEETDNGAYAGKTTWRTLCEPSASHYTFNGWYKNTSFTGDPVTSSTRVSNSELPDLTVYAKWTPVEYSISIDYAGGSGTNPTSYNIETASFTLNRPSRTGYHFDGWSGTGISGTVMDVTIPEGSFGDRSYTANWRPNTLTVAYVDAAGVNDIYDGNKTCGIGTPDHTCYYDGNCTIQGAGCAIGWWKQTGWSGLGLSSTHASTDLAAYGGCNLGAGDCTITLGPTMIKTKITIKYDCNGGFIVKQASSSAGNSGTECHTSTWDFDETAGYLKSQGVLNHDPDYINNTVYQSTIPMVKKGNCSGNKFHKGSKEYTVVGKNQTIDEIDDKWNGPLDFLVKFNFANEIGQLSAGNDVSFTVKAKYESECEDETDEGYKWSSFS